MSHWGGIMVIGTDCIGSCKSNYHTIMTAPGAWCQGTNFSPKSWYKQVTFPRDDFSFVLDHHAFGCIFIVPAHWNNSVCLDMSLHSGHITLNLSQPIFALTPYYCVPSREAVNTNLLVSLWFWFYQAPTQYHPHSRQTCYVLHKTLHFSGISR